MKDEREVMTIEALKSVLSVVESIRESGSTAFEAMILMKTPCSTEIMQLGMLLQASLGFSVALKKWIAICEENHAMIIEMNKKNGN